MGGIKGLGGGKKGLTNPLKKALEIKKVPPPKAPVVPKPPPAEKIVKEKPKPCMKQKKKVISKAAKKLTPKVMAKPSLS